MHTVELLDEAIKAAGKAGIQVREDGHSGDGGFCELRGQMILILNPAHSPLERLSHALEALHRANQKNPPLTLTPTLRRLLEKHTN